MPRTKIVCTIGPACDSPEKIRQLIEEGMSVARLNFSHGTHAEHAEKIRIIREVSDETGRPVAILQDLCGPKIRVGKVKLPGVQLKPGQPFVLTSEEVEGTEELASVSYPTLAEEVNPEDRILLADGMMELEVTKTSGNKVVCNVITGGFLTSNKGVNLPSGTLRIPSLTEKDRVDLAFGMEKEVDYVALSFVRRASDITEIKEIIEKAGKDIPVVAKIEKHEALLNLDEIMELTDGVMVARGDLGVETPLEHVPIIQKKIIRKANVMGKPVIVATQMLRSMVDSPRPTRAEANDVANAVLDGADAVMLSEETASGQYPVESVRYMRRIAKSAEERYPHKKYMALASRTEISDSVAYASCVLADHLSMAAIVAPTKSGFTAMQLSRFRPTCKIIAVSPDPVAVRRLALYWGCVGGLSAKAESTDDMLDQGAKFAMDAGYAKPGDKIVMTAGHPLWVKGTTNMLKVKEL